MTNPSTVAKGPDSAFAAEVREMLGVLSPTQPMIYPEVRAEPGSTPADRTLHPRHSKCAR